MTSRKTRGLTSAPPRPRITPGDRILFAGDGQLFNVLKSMLEADQAVVAIPDARTALDEAREHTPDLLVASTSLPGLDGLALVRALRADESTRDVPVLLVASDASVQERVDALEAGADEVLVEPYLERELGLRLRGLLRGSRARREIHEAHRERGRDLRHIAEKLRIVTDTMGVPVTRCTRDMTYAWANQRYADWIGLPLDHIVGRRITEVIGHEAFEHLRPMFDRVLGGEVVRYEEEVDFRGIGKRWINAIYTPTLDEQGEAEGWVAVVVDLTDRRASEQRITSDLDAITRLHEIANECARPDVDFGHAIEKVLDAAIALSGADKGNVQLVEPVTGRLRIVAQRGFDEPFLRSFEAVGRGDDSACGATLDASERVLVEDVTTSAIFRGLPSLSVLVDAGVRAVQSTPLLTSSGSVVGVVSTHYSYPRKFDERELRFLDLLARQTADFVARREVESSLREAELALRESDRRKDRFLATLAHELRNPLAAISNAVQIASRSDAQAGDIRSVSDILERQVRHMVRQIDDLLDMSRITRGTIELRKEPVDVAEALRHAVESTRPLCERMGHALTIAVPDRPVRVNGDPIRLEQLFGNLLNNAFKFTGRGGRVRVTLDVEGGDAVIRVRDTGVGIEGGQMEQIFEMFAQVDQSLERPQAGLGLGLTIARTLVELHGGTVVARSEGLGRGTEFVVRLPAMESRAPAKDGAAKDGAARDALAVEPAPLGRNHENGSPGPSPDGHRILLADDHVDAVEGLALILAREGHIVAVAHDGLEAISRAATFRPDVVLLDIGMPRLNGYDTARRIRAEHPDVVLVALTGWGQENDRGQSLEAGFDEHFVKPLDQATFAAYLASRPKTPSRD